MCFGECKALWPQCDTTSSFFKRGKTKIFKLFEKRHDLIDFAEVLTNIGSSPDLILTNGTRFLLAMYGAPKQIDSIEKYRYVCSNCQGQSCSNVESNITDEDAYDIDEEISDPSFFLEQSIEMQQQGEEVSEEEHITVEEFEDYFDDS
ncbi:hypothetical protein AVEN_198098-1 [Araneus ventricosus]|uniref:Uncharacterized protein n=1 Tax=Araneus ventricosus TaxID=182803 RepID=A0A4Y2VR27_ARAVE|nr:hypothetical protein AVEN_198098-1 [Araneus ventricosus]